MEKSRRLIKVPSLTAVYDVSGVAELNSISSKTILLSACRLLGQGKGGLTALSLCFNLSKFLARELKEPVRISFH
jgi:hypothetical protein